MASSGGESDHNSHDSSSSMKIVEKQGSILDRGSQNELGDEGDQQVAVDKPGQTAGPPEHVVEDVIDEDGQSRQADPVDGNSHVEEGSNTAQPLPQAYAAQGAGTIQEQHQNTAATAVSAISGQQSAPIVISPTPASDRPALPSRDVTEDTIEDAYIDFIMHCNPAVPLDVNTTLLRTYFNNIPRSGGSVFQPYHLYTLIRQLEAKEIKTWAELVVKLGVKPPIPENGESTQKIQQYAVRLKRWMRAMHFDAFVNYLLGIPHHYWTQIPVETVALQDMVRDGVAPEDDMAIRALVPNIRSRKNRRRFEHEFTVGYPPAQRLRLDSPVDESPRSALEASNGEWSAHPDRPNAPTPETGLAAGTASQMRPIPRLRWPKGSSPQPPAFTVPQSAITPSTGAAPDLWDSLEPRSAITPSKPNWRDGRHGPKVVSSAWKYRSAWRGQTRGSPAVSRSIADINNAEGGLFSTFMAVPPNDSKTPNANPAHHSLYTPGSVEASDSIRLLATLGSPLTRSAPGSNSSLQSRKRRLSLQVPQRPAGSVRLATPPGLVQVASASSATDIIVPKPAVTASMSASFTESQSGQVPPLTLDPNDRTNVAEVECFLINQLLEGQWMNAKGEVVEPAPMHQIRMLVDAIVATVAATADNKESMLAKLSTLVGSRLLGSHVPLLVTVTHMSASRVDYRLQWELRYGNVTGRYGLCESVDPSRSAADKWELRYRDLVEVLRQKDDMLDSMRLRLLAMEQPPHPANHADQANQADQAEFDDQADRADQADQAEQAEQTEQAEQAEHAEQASPEADESSGLASPQ